MTWQEGLVVPICPSLQKGQQSYFPLDISAGKVETSSEIHGERCLQELKGLLVKYVNTEMVCELWEHPSVLGMADIGTAAIQQGLAAL